MLFMYVVYLCCVMLLSSKYPKQIEYNQEEEEEEEQEQEEEK